MRQSFGGSVRAMGGGKGIVDVNVAEFGQGIDEARIVLGLGGMEPGIFQQKNVPVPHRLDGVLREFAGAVGSKADVASKLALKLHRDRLQ